MSIWHSPEEKTAFFNEAARRLTWILRMSSGAEQLYRSRVARSFIKVSEESSKKLVGKTAVRAGHGKAGDARPKRGGRPADEEAEGRGRHPDFAEGFSSHG